MTFAPFGSPVARPGTEGGRSLPQSVNTRLFFLLILCCFLHNSTRIFPSKLPFRNFSSAFLIALPPKPSQASSRRRDSRITRRRFFSGAPRPLALFFSFKSRLTFSSENKAAFFVLGDTLVLSPGLSDYAPSSCTPFTSGSAHPSP